jgi:serine/threonine-protein kinase
MGSSALEPGFRLGKYEVVAHIATGGMGTVHKALDLELRRFVALKVLAPEMAENEVVMERFRREARHAARLSHPHIVTVYECGFDEAKKMSYLALEFIKGIDLACHIAKHERLSPEEVRRILIQSAKALEHAFTHGVVHRDIKPSNLMLARVNAKVMIKLTDFGLAIAKDDNEFRVTREGNTVGTVDYMAPEQARDSRTADIRSDIYSLGCTAYHMLAGRAPFAQGGLGERILKHLEMPPADVRNFNPAISERFWLLLQKMLAKNPDDRQPTPGELQRELKHVVATEDMVNLVPPLSSSQRKTDYVSTAPTQVTIPAATTEPPPESVNQPAASGDQPPAEEPRRRRKKKRRPPPDPVPLISQEQARAAAAFHERAVQVLAEGGGADYARQLLGNCLKLDPFNTTYRKTLREMNRQAAGGAFSRWFGSLSVLTIKSRMRLARSSGDLRKVLEHAEDVLAQSSADVDAHLEMADAAVKLGAPELARWCLEQGRLQAPDNIDLMRPLARLYETLKEWKLAVALWQKIGKLDPHDGEVRRKINDLSAQDMLTSGNFQQH